MSKFSVLVCSCDGCVDILDAFFKLLKKYWPGLDQEIILSTETIDYRNRNFKIKNVHPKNPKCSWTERILDAVNKCSAEQILLLLDDFFIYDKVDGKKIQQTANWLAQDNKIATFTYWPLHHLSKPSKYKGFCERTKYSRSKIAMIAGIWNRPWLIKYLGLVNEGAWKFEIVGNEMCQKMKNPGKFFALIDSQDDILPYKFTLGLSSGKWIPETVEIFKKNKIIMDFEERGFIEPKYFPLGHALQNAFKLNSRVFIGKNFRQPEVIVNGGGKFIQEYHLKDCKNCARWIIADVQGFRLAKLDITLIHKNGAVEKVDKTMLAGSYKKFDKEYVFNGYMPYMFICSKNNSPIRIIKISGEITYPATKEQLDKSYMVYTKPEDETVQKYIDENNSQFAISSEAIGEIMLQPEVEFISDKGKKINTLSSTIDGKFKYELEIPKNTTDIIFTPNKNWENLVIYHLKIYMGNNIKLHKKYQKQILAPSPENKYLLKCCKNYNILRITGKMKKPIPKIIILAERLATKVKRVIIK